MFQMKSGEKIEVVKEHLVGMVPCVDLKVMDSGKSGMAKGTHYTLMKSEFERNICA